MASTSNLPILSVFLALLFTSSSVQAFCPIGCTCLEESTSVDGPTVDCDGAGLTSVPILFNPRIRSLRLSNNQISSVQQEELSFYAELELVDLSNNKILSIERGAFHRLNKLKTLKLNGNLLASLGIETFAGLHELTTLDLSDNGLRRLATSVFSDLRRLEILNVSKNSINHFSPGALTGLTSLRELYGQYNEMSVLPNVALRSTYALRVLDVSNNRLERIEDNSFSSLKELGSLNLAGNVLDTVDERAFTGLRSLHMLSLDSNRLRRIPTISFRPLTELRSLSISENHHVTEIATSAFEGLPKLRQLFFARCSQLRRIEVNAFSGLSKLELLMIAENRALTEIDSMAFEFDQTTTTDGSEEPISSRSSLRQVYLYGNNLSTLSNSLLPWSRLDELDLRWNPWRCDCEFGPWIGRVLRRINGLTSKSKTTPDGAICHGPDALKGRPLHSLRSASIEDADDDALSEDSTPDFDHCQSSWWTSSMNFILFAATVVASLSVGTIFLVMCLRYRRKLPCCYACHHKSSSYGGVSSHMQYRYAPPPGLPELCRYTRPPIDVEISTGDDSQDAYGVRRLLAERRKTTPDIPYFFTTTTTPTKYGDYHHPQEDDRQLFYDDPENQYATCSTSGYYSGLISSDSGSTRHILVGTPTTSGSFRVLQQYPVPITEL